MKKPKMISLITKVNQDTARGLKRIEMKRGLSVYGILQMMCDCIRRYMDSAYNLSEEMERAMSIFEHMEGWKDSINLAEPSDDKVIGEAIYFLYDPTGKKKGTRAVHVVKPFFGNWTQDVNIINIIDDTIRMLMPERYRRMWTIATDLDCKSLVELIDKLINRYEKEQDAEELRKLFEDDNRAANNKPLVYGERTKKKYLHSSPDDPQFTITFDEDDQ